MIKSFRSFGVFLIVKSGKNQNRFVSEIQKKKKNYDYIIVPVQR